MSKYYIRADSTAEQKLIIQKLMRGDVLGPYSEECAAIRFHIAELEKEILGGGLSDGKESILFIISELKKWPEDATAYNAVAELSQDVEYLESVLKVLEGIEQ